MKRVSVGDIELATVDQGTGIPLVLIHGFPLDHSMWSGQVAGLSDTCRVVTPDLRGFGESDVTDGTLTMARMADDVAALLDGLGISEPVVLGGLSMGGYVAWEFFKRHRARIRGLVLCDTRAIPDTPEVAQARRDTSAKVLAEGPRMLVEGMVPKLFSSATVKDRPDIVESMRQIMMNTSPQGIAAAALGMAERMDATPLLPEVDCPTLVIVGEEDAISTVEEMRGIAERIPQASLAEIPRAGHMSPFEVPEAVNQAIREFLSTV